MNWYLNPWLTTWRNAVNAEFPTRTKTSDGTIGDRPHSLTASEHNPDLDGSVDAYDMDVNLFGSHESTGSNAERLALEMLKARFQKDPGSQLWIHDGQIANRNIESWKRRPYHGVSKHDKHIHWQSRNRFEATKFKGTLDDIVDAINAPEPVGHVVGTRGRGVPMLVAPRWPFKKSFYFKPSSHPRYSVYVKAWQRQMNKRGWHISIDGYYGAKSAEVARKFQAEKRLDVDGLLGPNTFTAAWTTGAWAYRGTK